ncbi:MAG: glycosyltransferase [Planctomycetia bacterium]|nr:glycosyltransferase [Planctomycetia bacterium]
MPSRRLRLAVDASPLVVEPRRGVARALAHLRTGLAALADEVEVVVLAPAPGETPRAFRRRVAPTVRRVGFDAWYAPFSAFPAVEVPVVVCVHELPFVRLGPLEGRLRALAHRRWLDHDVARAAAIVVPSEATRADVVALRPDAAPRVHVVPHGFAPAGDGGGRGPGPRGPAARAGGVVLGARGPRKGLDVWARAVAGLEPVVPWTLVGRPPRGVLARVRGVPAEVLDDPDDAEVARRLAGAAVLAYPSRSEGFGYPPLEAMAAGVPVVASAAGAVPEVVGDAALLVPPGDPEALRAALRRVLVEPDVAAALVARGAARARAFPPEAAARSLLKIVREAVERGDA